MSEVKPVPYDGTEPYIFVSYAHKDNAAVWNAIYELQKRGCRVWYDNGIHPGTEWDAVIESKLENSAYYIGFITENYWASRNCLDELKYAADLDKHMVLAYLTECDIPLGTGLRMRVGRKQNIHRADFATESAFLDKLCLAEGIAAARKEKIHMPDRKAEIKSGTVSEKPAAVRGESRLKEQISFVKKAVSERTALAKKPPFLKKPANVKKPVSAGDYIQCGQYPQLTEQPQPVNWLVLKTEGTQALVISKYALDTTSYHTEFTGVTWEVCTLRNWLNGAFYEMTFSAQEQVKIQTSAVENADNPKTGVPGGNATQDKLFLLSIEEVEKYFKTDEERQCVPTRYASGSTGDSVNADRTCNWWLRSPGYGSSRAARVHYDGSVYYNRNFVDDADGYIRPAMWLSL